VRCFAVIANNPLYLYLNAIVNLIYEYIMCNLLEIVILPAEY